jgi:hypothetical protein
MQGSMLVRQDPLLAHLFMGNMSRKVVGDL